MAKHQYRVSTISNWVSNFGYSFLALQNESGSNRKMTIRSLEVQVLTAFCDAAGTLAPSAIVGMYRSSISSELSGEEMNKEYTSMDTSNVLPSTVKVRRNVDGIPSYTNLLHTVNLLRTGSTPGTQNTLYTHRQHGRIGKQRISMFGSSRTNNWPSPTERISVNQNEAIALCSEQNKVNMSTPVEVEVILLVNGKTFVWNFNSLVVPGRSVFSVENLGADSVSLIGYSTSELGTTDTPYIRLVKIGQLYTEDLADFTKQQLTVSKVDSMSPDIPSLKAYSDIGFIPDGVPEVYIAQASPAAAAPRGFNYLHTKDFNGPTLRTFLPEMCHNYRGGSLAGGDTLGLTMLQSYNDLLTRKAGIIINPGEGIALVSSAETAIGVLTAFSGWPTLLFTAVIDDEPLISPAITINGIPEGAEVRIRQGSYTLTYQSNIQGGTYTYLYDATDAPATISVIKPGLVIEPIQFLLSATIQTASVVYSLDPSYVA